MNIFTRRWTSPIGEMLIATYGGRLVMTDWAGGKQRNAIDRRLTRLLGASIVVGDDPLMDRAVTQLEEYFVGTRREFTLPLLTAGTPFQKAVWDALLKLPYGVTATYAQIAAAVGRPKAVRAVANACAVNPLTIVIPCHRVIGSGGSLTGYDAGLDVKRQLLALEVHIVNEHLT